MQIKHTQSDPIEVLAKQKRYDRQLTTSALCIAAVFFLSLSSYTPTTQNLIWYEIKRWGLVAVPLVLSSFAFIHVLPVLLRGIGTQRISAVLLLVVAGYFAFQNWGAMVCDYVLNH
jgi:hypothetical protein